MTEQQDLSQYAPGVWRCPKCKFRLIQSNLNGADGTVTARDQAGGKCPNCNGPLWRVSWKEEAHENSDLVDHFFERATTAERELEALKGSLFGPLAHFWVNADLGEDDWNIEDDPVEAKDVALGYASIPLFAKQADIPAFVRERLEVGGFLNLLDKDIAQHPEKLVPLSEEMLQEVDALTAGVEVDLDKSLLEQVELPALIAAGRQLANAAFNLSQSQDLDDRARATLKACQQAWDSALSDFQQGSNADG